MISGAEASNSKASMRSSLEAGSKTVSNSDKDMEVFIFILRSVTSQGSPKAAKMA